MNLAPVADILGSDLLSSPLLAAILEHADDKMWRVRLAIILNMPVMAKHLGKEFFDSQLKPIFNVGLIDPIYSIRQACIAIIKDMSDIFGPDWTVAHLVPAIKAIPDRKNNALTRCTVLHAISALTCLGGSVCCDLMLPLATKYCDDPVANVRFEAAKTMQAIIKVADASVVKGQIVPLLTKMSSDADKDVQFYSGQALKAS